MGSRRQMPGENYLNCEVFGESMPPEEEIHARCRRCFPDNSAVKKPDGITPSICFSSISGQHQSQGAEKAP